IKDSGFPHTLFPSFQVSWALSVCRHFTPSSGEMQRETPTGGTSRQFPAVLFETTRTPGVSCRPETVHHVFQLNGQAGKFHRVGLDLLSTGADITCRK